MINFVSFLEKSQSCCLLLPLTSSPPPICFVSLHCEQVGEPAPCDKSASCTHLCHTQLKLQRTFKSAKRNQAHQDPRSRSVTYKKRSRVFNDHKWSRNFDLHLCQNTAPNTLALVFHNVQKCVRGLAAQAIHMVIAPKSFQSNFQFRPCLTCDV